MELKNGCGISIVPVSLASGAVLLALLGHAASIACVIARKADRGYYRELERTLLRYLKQSLTVISTIN